MSSQNIFRVNKSITLLIQVCCEIGSAFTSKFVRFIALIPCVNSVWLTDLLLSILKDTWLDEKHKQFEKIADHMISC